MAKAKSSKPATSLMEHYQSFLRRISSTKFLMSIIAIAVGTGIELYTVRGLSAEMAGLLVFIVGIFGAANTVLTAKGMKIEAKGDDEVGVTEPPAPVDLSPVVEAIQQRGKEQEQLGEAILVLTSTVDTNTKLLRMALGSNQNNTAV